MDKPKIKREVAVDTYYERGRIIYFYATTDALSMFSSFGEVMNWGNSKYRLEVDARYDFDEVVKYIQEYGQP